MQAHRISGTKTLPWLSGPVTAVGDNRPFTDQHNSHPLSATTTTFDPHLLHVAPAELLDANVGVDPLQLIDACNQAQGAKKGEGGGLNQDRREQQVSFGVLPIKGRSNDESNE